MSAPALATVITTGAAGTGVNDSFQTGFNKVNANDAAINAYAASLEARLARMETYSYAPGVAQPSPATDNTGFLYAKKASVWTTDALVTSGSKLLFNTNTAYVVCGMDILATDANGIPSLLLFVVRNGTTNFYAQTVSYNASTGAFANVATSAAFATVTPAGWSFAGVTRTSAQAARVLFVGLSSVPNVDYLVDFSCDATGANISLTSTVMVQPGSGKGSGVRPSNACPFNLPVTPRSFQAGSASIVAPISVGSETTGAQYRTPEGYLGFTRYSRTPQNLDSWALGTTPLNNAAPVGNVPFAMDVAGAGKFWVLAYSWQMGYGLRPAVKMVALDDTIARVTGDCWMPYAYSSSQPTLAALSGSLALAQFYDGNTWRTVGMQAGTDGSVIAYPNAVDTTGIYVNTGWKAWLTYSTSILAVLTQQSATAFTWTYAKFDITQSTPLSQSPAAGATFAMTLGTYGTATTVRGVLRLGQTASTDDYLVFGDSSGTGGGCWVEAHRLS